MTIAQLSHNIDVWFVILILSMWMQTFIICLWLSGMDRK